MINLALLKDWKVAEMAILFDKLPTILVLAVMVGIFVALRRHVKSARLHLWIAAWVLIFVHFFVQVFEPADGNLTPVTFMIDLGCLQLSALFFVASLTSFFENTRLTLSLLALTGIPVLAYTAGLAYELKWRWLYISCSAIIFYGSPLFMVLRRKIDRRVFYLGADCCYYRHCGDCACMAWHFDFGFLAMLTLGFALPGISFLQALSALVARRGHQRRRLPAVGRGLSRRTNAGYVGARTSR